MKSEKENGMNKGIKAQTSALRQEASTQDIISKLIRKIQWQLAVENILIA